MKSSLMIHLLTHASQTLFKLLPQGIDEEKIVAVRSLNDKTFTWFIYLLGPPVVGCDTWKKHRTNKHLSEILTVSDEAFILLTFLNDKEKWEFWLKKWYIYNWQNPNASKAFLTIVYIQKQENITKLSPRIFIQWFPDTPLNEVLHQEKKERQWLGDIWKKSGHEEPVFEWMDKGWSSEVQRSHGQDPQQMKI